MVKHFLRKKSKRMSCKTRYKVEKNVKQHKKKVRREEKKNPKKRRTKDPGVPNSLPFKDKILKDAQDYKEKELELKRQQKAARQKLYMEKRGLEKSQTDDEKNNESEIVIDSEAPALPTTVRSKFVKPFYRDYQKVIECADVILEVLDARNPLGSRCSQIEKAVMDAGPNKRLILVLNKIDLIPSDGVTEWLTYLRKEFPTVPFKAIVKAQIPNSKRSKQRKVFNSKTVNSSVCFGADILVDLLENYCKNRNMESPIRIGVVGLPNVGKISVINSFIRNLTSCVEPEPGIPRALQTIELAKNVILLTSPGLVFAKKDVAGAALLNAWKMTSLDDAMPAVEEIVNKATVPQMMLSYRISKFSNPVEFLTRMSRFCPMQAGGKADVEEAARFVVRGWTTGNTRYYSKPPESRIDICKELVQQADDFDVKSLESKKLSQFINQNLVLANEAIKVGSSLITEGTTEGFEFVDEEEPTQVQSDKNDVACLKAVEKSENFPKKNTSVEAYDFAVDYISKT